MMASGTTCLLTSFCTVTGHFQAALEDSSVWTIIRLTLTLLPVLEALLTAG